MGYDDWIFIISSWSLLIDLFFILNQYLLEPYLNGLHSYPQSWNNDLICDNRTLFVLKQQIQSLIFPSSNIKAKIQASL